MYSTNEITKTGIYLFKKNALKNIFFFCTVFVIFLVFNEVIVFRHFLFINITKFRFFLLFRDHTDIKKWKLKIFWRLWLWLLKCFKSWNFYYMIYLHVIWSLFLLYMSYLCYMFYYIFITYLYVYYMFLNLFYISIFTLFDFKFMW